MNSRQRLQEAISAVALLAIVIAMPLSGQPGSMLSYLPDESRLDGWEALGEPQIAEGEDLFLLINGGAEIYKEYGFSRAVMHSYTKGDRSVNLEVYEMEDAASAYGAYSFKTARQGEPIEIGSEARFEDYYLNFWKGRVVVTLIGFDTHPETRDGILKLARMVEAKITSSEARPGIMELLPPVTIGGIPVHPTYVEGNLGLINRYRFGDEDIFESTCAAVGDYGEHMLFLFPYGNPARALDQIAIASQRLDSSGLYTNTAVDDFGFTGEDRDGRTVVLRPISRYLIAYVGTSRADAFRALEEMSARIALHEEGRVP